MDDEVFGDCYRAFRTIYNMFDDLQALGVQHLHPGPTGCCGVCSVASSSSTTQEDAAAADAAMCAVCTSQQAIAEGLASAAVAPCGLADASERETGCLLAAAAASSIMPAAAYVDTPAAAKPATAAAWPDVGALLVPPHPEAPTTASAPPITQVSDPPSHEQPANEAILELRMNDWAAEGPSRHLVVTADGNYKLNHNANCGTKTAQAFREADLQPRFQRFFGKVNSEVAANLKAVHAPAKTHEDEGVCTANLSCARRHATARATELDEKCVVGFSCTHGVPLQGLFLSSPTHEQFRLYDMLLKECAHQENTPSRQLAGLVLDINCQYEAHVRNLDAEFASSHAFLIGWLHSKSGHNLDCQLRYSAMFAPGTGRLIGENMEHIWVRGLLTHSPLFWLLHHEQC
jgi:hypothetical protein